MNSPKKLTFKILFFLLLIDCLEGAAQYFYKKSALSVDGLGMASVSDAIRFVSFMLGSPWMWMGCLMVAVIFVIWSTVISKIDLSVAVPASSLNFISVPLVALFFLHETISPLRWFGIMVILAGVVIVSLSSRREGA